MARSSEAALLGDSAKVGSMKYKETQIHGEVCFLKHVDRLVAHPRHRRGFEKDAIDHIYHMYMSYSLRLEGRKVDRRSGLRAWLRSLVGGSPGSMRP